MELLDLIPIEGANDKRVELLQGDLTDAPEADPFDVLVVSAFPDNYVPTPNSLIGALDRKGISVERLAQRKEIDLRKYASCWLSGELHSKHPGIRFRRILCFEPLQRGTPPAIVGDIFRALLPMVGAGSGMTSVAMPVVATGNQGYPLATMLEPQVEAAIEWLKNGLQLNRIKVVLKTDADPEEAVAIFSKIKASHLAARRPSGAATSDYDVFISYSRKNEAESRMLEDFLRKSWPEIRIFLDQNELDTGSAWQRKIFESLDRCEKVVALLSPDYLASDVCQEEFNIAWIRGRKTGRNIIFPIYLYSADLPSYMEYLNHIDCREGNDEKLLQGSKKLLGSFGRSQAPAGQPGRPAS